MQLLWLGLVRALYYVYTWIKAESFLKLVYCDFKFRACCSHQASNKNGTKWYRWEHFHKSKSSNRPQLLLGSRSALLCAGSLRRSPASCSAWPAPPWRGCTSIPLGTICTAWWWCCNISHSDFIWSYTDDDDHYYLFRLYELMMYLVMLWET